MSSIMKRIYLVLLVSCTMPALSVAQNVGIGQPNPGFPLNFANLFGDKISFWGNSGNNYGIGIQSNLLQLHTDIPGADIAFGYGSSTSFTERMRIKGNGMVGIGTSPGYVFDVFDVANQGFFINFNSNNASNSFVQLQSNAPLPNTANIGFGMYRNGGAKGYVYVNGSNNLILSTTGTENIIVSPAGNVGIGQSSPNFPLNFANSLGDKISLYGNVTNTYGFGIQNSLLQIHSDGSGADIAFGYGSSNAFTEKMRIKGNGNLGIGVTNPVAKLHIVQDGNYSATEGSNGNTNHGLEIRDNSTATEHILYMGADASNQFSYIQSVASGGYRDLLLQGRGGNVIIGKDLPVTLSVKGDLIADYAGSNTGTTSYALRFGSGSSGEVIASKRNAGGNQYGLDLYTNSVSRVSISNSGQVTIPGTLTISGFQALVTDVGGQRQKILIADAGLASPGGGYNPGYIGAGVYSIASGVFTAKPTAWIASFTSTSGDCHKISLTTEVVASGGSWNINLHAMNPSGGIVNFNGVWKLMIMGPY